jgi:SAM-dependent methyltransferase
MRSFYGDPATRPAYQAMVDGASDTQLQVERALIDAVVARRPRRVLEVGAGSGRLFERLRAAGLTAKYIGVDLSPDLIAANRRVYPDAEWFSGGIDDPALAPTDVDVVFAYFVLEHCVYPARVLRRMASMMAPAGSILLVFPDFVATGRFASQSLGRADGLAGEQLRRGDVVNALVTLYDARIRLPRALRHARRRCGSFPVNLAPRCLEAPGTVGPDEDAVYIASRREVVAWAEREGWSARFPAGDSGPFRDVVFVELTRQERR